VPAGLQGTYFLVADIRPLAGRGSRKQRHDASVANGNSSSNGSAVQSGSSAGSPETAAGAGSARETDVSFCQRLTVEAGVTLIPVRTCAPDNLMAAPGSALMLHLCVHMHTQ
jgi:hypothetical protein